MLPIDPSLRLLRAPPPVVRSHLTLSDPEHISERALTVAPGTYTLILWVDFGLSPVSRRVPLNSDGMGLYGCQVVFDVADDAQTEIAVTATLVPDCWDTSCNGD